MSLLLVDTQTPGYSRGRRLEKLGMHAQDMSDLFFTDVDVGPDALLGPARSGFKAMMKELPQERLLLAIAAVAAMESAVQWTRDHVAQRQAFGAPLSDKQTIRRRLAHGPQDSHCLPAALPTRLARARRTWREPQTGRPWLRIKSATLHSSCRSRRRRSW